MSAPPRQPVTFFHRYRNELQTESIYGERWLRWAYENPLGRLATWAIVRRALFSRLYGKRMDRPASRERIRPFIDRYGIDASEFVKKPGDFLSFNDFFTRELTPDARPVDASPRAAVFPADGRHLGVTNLSKAAGLYIKGEAFDLASLLGDNALAEKYREGSLIISRLCPVDYHRFHFPLAGAPGMPRRIPGGLYSVNPIALRRNIGILARNRRVVTTLENTRAGKVLLIEIGATNVGSIVQTFSPGQPAAMGAEKGYFQFGGSTVLTLFEPGAIALAPDLAQHGAEGREVYARMGDRMAAIT